MAQRILGLWIIAALAGGLAESTAYAQESRGPAAASAGEAGPTAEGAPAARSPLDRRRLFEQLDQDSDGQLTLDEAPESLRDRIRPLFERLDTDAITLDEFQRFNAGRRESRRVVSAVRGPAIFRVLDEDGDDLISRDELARAGEEFDVLDEDRNGGITPDELFALPGGDVGARSAPTRTGSDSQPDRPVRSDSTGDAGNPADPTPANEPATQATEAATQASEPAAQARESGGRDLAGRLFARYDRDGDGRLSQAEAPAALRQQFERFDGDGDTYVSRSEFDSIVTAVEQIRGRKTDPDRVNGQAAEASPVAGAEPRRAED